MDARPPCKRCRCRCRGKGGALRPLRRLTTPQSSNSSAAKARDDDSIVGEFDTAPGIPLPAAPDDTLAFDREWAHALIARALAALQGKHAEKAELFSALKPWLDGGVTGSQAATAAALGVSAPPVKVAIHRLRARFRELVRAEVAATVNDPAEAVDELCHRIAIASSGR